MHSPQSKFRVAKTSASRVLTAVLAVCCGMLAAVLPAVPADAQGSANFVFTGAGWGHGVGMSQNGARNMADQGFEHTAILNKYYPNSIVTQTASLGNIRVHLGDASRVEISSAGSITFSRGGVAINAIPSGSISVAAHDGGLQVGNAWTSGSRSDPLYVTFPQPVKLTNNGHRYLWGRLQITNKNGKVRVVEDVPMEQYVAGISEMPAAWPLEALMAQAIAARTYAHEVTLHRRNSEEWAQEYDISGSTVDQNYIGWDAQDSAWDQKWLAAVQATAGVEIVDSSGPIRAYYSATNGGYTETAAYVFGNDVPYTVAGPDPFDAGGHDWTTWTRSYSQESMSRWLNAKADTSVGSLQSIEVLGGEGASARLDKAVVELVGSSGTKRVTGKRLMLAINAGVFGEGGGLSTHLPGTFTTIGNGASKGAPRPGGIEIPASVTPDVVADSAQETDAPTSADGTFVPPPGWTPEPGTGVAPGGSAPSSIPATGEAPQPASGFVPPPGWTPEPGTGVPPGTPVAPGTSEPTAEAPSGAGFVPPPGWTPEPGTGVPPRAPVAPAPAAGSVEPAYVPPSGWEPEPGSGVPPGNPVAPSGAAEPENTEAANGEEPEATEEAATPASTFLPPEGWVPTPGTGIAPTAAAATAGVSLASTVLLITRGGDEDQNGQPTAKFEVLSPSDELADEARERLEQLQSQAAIGLFAEFDIEGYVASVAPRPVHGICTATDAGVTCVPLSTYLALIGKNND